MANEQHVKILTAGNEIWNNWRISNPQIRPDLSDSILKFRWSSGLWNFHGANFYDSNLAAQTFAQFRVFELYMEGPHSHCDVSPTV